jgi:membrane-associated protease RseP (regulator of RpoE activity)
VIPLLTALLAVITVTAVHEAGHVAAVRAKGGRVRRVQLGRGPDVWSRTVRGATVAVALVPLGGGIQFDGVPPGTGRAVVAVSGAAANLALAFVAFATVALLLEPDAAPMGPDQAGVLSYAAAHAGAWFWAVPGAVVELVTTGGARELRRAVAGLLQLLADHPGPGFPYALGALSALWAALNLIPIPVIETDGWHAVRAFWPR